MKKVIIPKLTIEAIKEIAQNNPDGFTVDIWTGTEKFHSGYAIAREETQRKPIEFVYEFAKNNNVRCIGGWFNGNEYFFDAVDIFYVTENEAKEIGRERNQLAIFNLENRKEITL